MRGAVATVAVVVAAAAAAAPTAHGSELAIRPAQIAHSALAGMELGALDELEQALVQDGLVQVTGVPGLARMRQAALTAAVDCAALSEAARATSFADGTVRRTLASLTRGSEAAGFAHGAAHAEGACAPFERASATLRASVDATARGFVRALDDILGTAKFTQAGASPLLEAAQGSAPFSSLAQVVAGGDQLEHFHSYARGLDSGADEEDAIELHTDQGIMIAFIPALMVGEGSPENGEFYVELSGGERAQVEFADEGNVVVFMLGDGVNQIINPWLREHRGIALRATPHGLRMPRSSQSDVWRSWYGRMFLPPANAIHADFGVTFGELRDAAVEASAGRLPSEEAASALSLGCSRNLYARDLAAVQCAEDQIYCWHRCMDHTADASPEACAAKGMVFNCTSEYNQVWLPEIGHGDYNPGCVAPEDADNIVTPHPTFSPKDPDCGSFESFADADLFDGVRKLSDTLALYFSVLDESTVLMHLVHDGPIGWMAIGYENPGGGHNGMNGANVVMAVVDEGGETGEVNEYHVHDQASAFRHWDVPIPATFTNATLEIVEGCFASMTFETTGFNQVPFNLSDGAENLLIWAVHTTTWRHQYHGGPGFRGHLALDFGVLADPIESDENPAPGSMASTAWASLALAAACVLGAL